MKTQITTIAAAIAFAMSTAASAQYWAGSDSTIEQKGDNNTNNITQMGTQESRVQQEGDHNSTLVSQSGKSNDSYVYQEQNNNTSNVNQDGFLNKTVSLQIGTHNTSSATQNDNWNDNYTYQEGSNNTATVSQEGYFNKSVTEQNGDYNNAQITQSGEWNDSYTYLEGNHNTVVVVTITLILSCSLVRGMILIPPPLAAITSKTLHKVATGAVLTTLPLSLMVMETPTLWHKATKQSGITLDTLCSYKPPLIRGGFFVSELILSMSPPLPELRNATGCCLFEYPLLIARHHLTALPCLQVPYR